MEKKVKTTPEVDYDNEFIKEVIKPIGDIIITTASRYSDNKMMTSTVVPLKDTQLAGTVKEFQTVVSVGPYAENQGISVGDKVLVNLSNYADTRFKKETLQTASQGSENYNTVVNYYIPKLSIDGQDHLRLSVRDIVAVVTTDYKTLK